MNKICDLCSHQRSDGRGGVQCGIAHYHTDPEGYGTFKQGAGCVNDAELKNLFEPRTGAEINVKNMASIIERQGNDLMLARDRISKLEARLLKVDV